MKNKILPLIVAIIIIALGITIWLAFKNNQEHYEKLIITYNGEAKEYTKISLNDIFVVDNITFTVVGKNPDKIMLYSSSSFDDNVEHEISLNNQKVLCASANKCIYWDLK